jgi:hypothetical protein
MREVGKKEVRGPDNFSRGRSLRWSRAISWSLPTGQWTGFLIPVTGSNVWVKLVVYWCFDSGIVFVLYRDGKSTYSRRWDDVCIFQKFGDCHNGESGLQVWDMVSWSSESSIVAAISLQQIHIDLPAMSWHTEWCWFISSVLNFLHQLSHAFR